MIANAVVFILGAALVMATVLSAVRTIVLPHGRSARITRALFQSVRRVVALGEQLPGRRARRHEIRSLYAPVALVCLPMVWLSMALVGFTAMFWALETRPVRDAFKLAGSSMLTIGFFDIDDIPRLAVGFFAAALTISLLGLLLVTYLPSMYQAYSARETAITELETFAGEPPSPAELLIRHHQIGARDQVPDVWRAWQKTFFELRETHTALPAVVVFRSSSPDRHWIQAVETILDAAALWNVVGVDREDPQASLCIRAGTLALNDIAEFFRIPLRPNPRYGDPVSVERQHFESLHAQLVDAGFEVTASAEDAWPDWSGWRVNYDQAVQELKVLTGAGS